MRGFGPEYPARKAKAACAHKALTLRAALARGESGDDPLFTTSDRFGTRRPMTAAKMKKLGLDVALAACPPGTKGINPRKGAASAMLNAGFSEALIKIHGKWRSDAWRSYAQLSPSTAANIMDSILA